jgi:cobalt-precorrin 5A hydrolase/precorrin-3B C17-methyltransferase
MSAAAKAPAIVVLGPGGMKIAGAVKAAVPGASIHGFARRVADADIAFDDTAEHLRMLFRESVPIVGLCAAGILIRALAPVLSDKRTEPPVIALAEDGSNAVPLLGGHHGANVLAARIAELTGGRALLTTAGEVRFGVSLDEPPAGWTIANPELVKPATADLLAGVPVGLAIEASDAAWLAGVAFAETGERRVLITDRAGQDDANVLVLHPPVLALGVGCERGTGPEELKALAEHTLASGGLAPGAIACIVSLDLKMDEPAVNALATHLGVPARFFDAAALEAETPRLATPSEIVFREVGCHGVAEAAALAAAGPNGDLIVAKQVSRRATCAVARAPYDIDPTTTGTARGHLAVVGIGPGAGDWRTPEVSRLLAEADVVVGYGLYLDLLGNAIAGKTRHEAPLGHEEARARMALDLAAAGRGVALVSSGDAGIYALATLVFELLDREARPEWRRVEVRVAPGISALQAAAARIGAPLGHDFCTVSLSDLLTPWKTIENRLRAAADGDFVLALYNPVSQRRRTQLAAARDILLAVRARDTPVVLARNLGRDGEGLCVTTLGELTADDADMLTVILVGSSQTRCIETGNGGTWVYTPRGYAAKSNRKPRAAE